MDDIEIPQYFVCPISLHIMKDPVTAITGITYDRECIEHWLFCGKNTTCPVTKLPLPRDSDLTPNHTLRRLIQAWCTDNASHGIDRIPTPKPPLSKAQIVKMLKDLWNPQFQSKILSQLELIAAENERNRKYMVEAGVPRAMLLFLLNNCFKKSQTDGLEEAVSILSFIGISSSEIKQILMENEQILDTLTWVLSCSMGNDHFSVKTHALLVWKSIVEKANSSVFGRLKPEFFKLIVGILKNNERSSTPQEINAALHIMLDTCPWGRNRIKMIEAGAVFELIQYGFGVTERKTTELVFGILFHMCSCADGRAQFLSHKASIFLVSKKILRVSPAVDDRAVMILSLVCKYSATNTMLQEMVEVGVVQRLCTLFQVNCASYLKDKAREILRSHSGDWKKSPCIDGARSQAV
ncbi:E3 ubiquitin-protein ligase PUB24 [Ziziphus jujuba]|uniref:U-box domain-containing protein n=2 Tax=Ziziphus jujuba TaxID=326968 RepID=A0A6P3Z243_ZIZJJ|nr:E3 ubiquitin-protein ligase PUB24 [Ziziphus jujuba]KAH7512254.1 hypothetical protein FEM48_Zijuj12G0070900 [Ziziphus jujuba var. spinosa]